MSQNNEYSKEQLEEALLTMNKEIHTWEAAMQTEPWKAMVDFVNEQVELRRNDFELTEVTGVDSLVAKEFPRGEISGLRLAIEQPQRALDDMKETAAGLKDQMAALEETDDDDD